RTAAAIGGYIAGRCGNQTSRQIVSKRDSSEREVLIAVAVNRKGQAGGAVQGNGNGAKSLNYVRRIDDRDICLGCISVTGISGEYLDAIGVVVVHRAGDIHSDGADANRRQIIAETDTA